MAVSTAILHLAVCDMKKAFTHGRSVDYIMSQPSALQYGCAQKN